MKSQRHVLVFAALAAASTMSILRAETLQSARVTRIIREVNLMNGAAVRPAAVSDEVTGKSAVRTGTDSRAELTFGDLTITRLGANTIFSFNEAARELTLNQGAILVSVPRNSASLKVTTAAVSAGISGGTASMNANAGGPTKLFVFEGHGTMCSKKTGECQTASGGEFVMATANGHITKPEEFNEQVLYASSPLITDFSLLQNRDLIEAVIAQQQGGGVYRTEWPPTPPREYIDMLDVIDQAFDGFIPVLSGVSLTTVSLNVPSGNWSSASSWKPNVVPNDANGNQYNAVISSGSVTQNIPGGVAIQRLQMSGGILVLSNPLKLNAGLRYSGGTIGGTSTLSIFGTSTQSTTLALDGPTINNHGTYNLTFDSAPVFSGAGAFNNSGTVTKVNGMDVLTFNLHLNNTGTVNAANGALVFASGGMNSGTFSSASGAGVNFASNFAMLNGTMFSGNASFNDSTNTTLSGTITNNGAIFLNSAGSNFTDFTLNGDVTLTGNGVVNLTNADRILGNGALSTNNRFQGDNVGGTFGGDQIGIVLQAGGSINATANVLTVDPGSSGLSNAGAMTAANGATLLLSGNGTGGFSNTGTISTVSGGTLVFNGAVSSSGIVDVRSGTLNITGAGSFTQTVAPGTSTGATFRMSGGTVNSTTALNFQGGMIDAHGTINAPSIQNNATLQPALGGNGLAVKANVALLQSSNLSFQLGGLTQGTQYSSMNVNGTVALGGKLVLAFANGFQNSVTPADNFTLLTSTTNFSGSFSNIASGMRLETSDNVGSFVVDYSGNTLTLSNFKLGPVVHGAGVKVASAKTSEMTIKLSSTAQLRALLEDATPNAKGKFAISRIALKAIKMANNHAQPNRDENRAARRLLPSRSSLALAGEGQRHR